MSNFWITPIIGLVFLCPQAKAQMVPSDAHREANFLYEVKVIDEFIERFNDDPNSALRKEYVASGRMVPFNRVSLLKALFAEPLKLTDTLAAQFISQITDTLQPELISFNDSNWYDEVSCVFSQDGRRVEIPLIMRVNTAANRSSKWMVSGIGPSPIFRNEVVESSDVIVDSNKRKRFISPSDYATNFLEFHHILEPKMNELDYFETALLATDRGRKFVQLVKSGKLKFEQTNNMKFYFFQIPNFEFTVERYNRNSTHSGWLISELNSSPDSVKTQNVDRLLGRNLL